MTKEYIGRVNKVLNYIEQHISENFPLEELAGVAAFFKNIISTGFFIP
jgi:transcriptional regulator GlxA family with amidase domain